MWIQWWFRNRKYCTEADTAGSEQVEEMGRLGNASKHGVSPYFVFFRNLYQRRVYVTQSGFSQKRRSQKKEKRKREAIPCILNRKGQNIGNQALMNHRKAQTKSDLEVKNLQKTNNTSQLLHTSGAGKQQRKTEVIIKLISVKPQSTMKVRIKQLLPPFFPNLV